MASCCGGIQGDTTLNVKRGAVYNLSGLWTHKVDDVVVPLVAADWNARFVVRRKADNPDELLDITSDPDTGITLIQEGDSVRFYIEIGASVTATLPVGRKYFYTLAFENIADPEDVRVVLNDDKLNVTNTAL